jgi:hypothetical protein
MVDFFAGFAVSGYDRALQWYRLLLGRDPSFYPNDRESVWEVGEHCYVYFEVLLDRAGGAMSMVMVEDIDGTVSEISDRGIEASSPSDRSLTRVACARSSIRIQMEMNCLSAVSARSKCRSLTRSICMQGFLSHAWRDHCPSSFRSA